MEFRIIIQVENCADPGLGPCKIGIAAFEIVALLGWLEDTHAASHRLAVVCPARDADDRADPRCEQERDPANSATAPAHPVLVRDSEIEPVIPEIARPPGQAAIEPRSVAVFDRQPVGFSIIPFFRPGQTAKGLLGLKVRQKRGLTRRYGPVKCEADADRLALV